MSGDQFFYTPGAVKMNPDEFVDFYSGCYYIGGEKIPRLSQSSRYIENEIDRLLKDGIKKKTDVAHILAWKIGKIRHGKSESEGKFVYAEDWTRADELDVTLYKKPFKLGEIATFITDHIDELQQQADENPQAVLDRLRKEKFAGLGPVYMITLLYFISKGKWPIYDRFAKMALYAILNDIKPGGVVEYKGLPDKNSKAFSNIIIINNNGAKGCAAAAGAKDDRWKEESEYTKYIDELEQVFDEQYLSSRDVDRALWVYGHLFTLK